MALVAVALVGREADRHPPLAALVLPAPEAAGHRHDVGVAELLQRLGREGRAHAARAVHDDGRGLVEHLALDLALEVAAGDVERAREGALVVLVGLADVEHHGARRPAGLVGRGGVDLADLGLRLGQQIAEARHGLKAYLAKSGFCAASARRSCDLGSAADLGIFM